MCDEESNLEKLRKLTAKLPVLGPSSYKELTPGKIDYQVLRGRCTGMALLNIPEVAVQRVCLEASTVFPEHSHNEIEVIVIYKGEGLHITPGMKSRVTAGESYISRPGELHEFRAVTDCELIAITIPASAGYPREAGDTDAARD